MNTWIVICMSCLCQVLANNAVPTLYWTLNEVDGFSSCLYAVQGDPTEWVPLLALGGQVIADPLCVNNTLYRLGPLAADTKSTYEVFTLDYLGGGMTIFQAYHNGGVESYFGGFDKMNDLAVDWLSQNVYYTDPHLGIVILSYTDDEPHFKILYRDVEEPYGIVVDPVHGYVFWADAGSGTIKRMTVTGEYPVTIVDDQREPLLLTLDQAELTLYWLDPVAGSISQALYDGTGVEAVVISDDILPGVFSGLEVHGEYLFGLLADEATIVIWNKTSGEEMTSLTFTDVHNATQHGIAMAVDNPVTESLCNISNGGCEHICVYTGPNDRQCLCDTGYDLDTDGTSCITDYLTDDFLIVSDIGTGRLYQVGLPSGSVHGIPVSPTYNQRLEGVTYDPIDQMVYWIDTGNGTLRSMDLKAGGQEKIVYEFGEGSLVEGIAYDGTGRFIYYTDAGLSVIGRISVDTQQQGSVLTFTAQEYPFRIQLDIKAGMMYWTNVGFPATIERAKMEDGSDREILINTDIQVPSGLALNIADSQIYWTDEFLFRVEKSNFDGTDRELVQSTDGVYSLTLDNTYIYTGLLHEIRKYSTNQVVPDNVGPAIFSNIFALHLYSSSLIIEKPIVSTPSPTTRTPSAAAIHQGHVAIFLLPVIIQLLRFSILGGQT